jgi:hypothetical protein
MHSNHWLYSWKTRPVVLPVSLGLIRLMPLLHGFHGASSIPSTSSHSPAFTYISLPGSGGARWQRHMPMLSFQKGGQAHYTELERNRARHANCL